VVEALEVYHKQQVLALVLLILVEAVAVILMVVVQESL
jgi:hypothetical protein